MAEAREIDRWIIPPDEEVGADYSEGSGRYAAELRHMKDLAFCRSAKFADQQARANRDGAHEQIVEFEKALVKRMRVMGVPMWAHTMVRTREDQAGAFMRGVSKNDGKKAFPHMKWAVDIVHGTRGWGLNKKQWEIVSHLGLEIAAQRGIKIVWGGNFHSLYDPAHWELAEWRELAAQPLATL
jgi:hypothetical protein